MGKKWRDAAEVERGCSDRDDNAESRRRSRSASRGRFAESWKRLSSKQGSTKRSGLPSQQTPVSGPGRTPGSLAPSARDSSPFHGAELASFGARAWELVERLLTKESGGCEEGQEGTTSLSSARGGSPDVWGAFAKMEKMFERRGAHWQIVGVSQLAERARCC